jgi:hypothetical protein
MQMPISPTAEGFRAAFRRPSLALAEITWRWVTGVTAALLFLFALYHYLDTLPVNSGELLFLRSGQPYLVAQAIAHILRGSLGRVVLAGMVSALLLGLLWIIAGALGRMATVRALLDYFRKSGAHDAPTSFSTFSTGSLPALVRLNFLRAGVAVAALVGFVGAWIIAGFASPASDPQPGLAFLLFLPLAALISLAWSSLNWLLSLAGLFAVRDGQDTVGAISSAVSFCRERAGAVAAVSTWTGLAHLSAFVAATTAISMPMGFAGLLPWRLVLLVMLLMTMVYFALADWLYMARLAGYVCIVETPPELMRPAPLPTPMPVFAPLAHEPPPASVTESSAVQSASVQTSLLQTSPLETSIDRDESILSDVPNPPEE